MAQNPRERKNDIGGSYGFQKNKTMRFEQEKWSFKTYDRWNSFEKKKF